MAQVPKDPTLRETFRAYSKVSLRGLAGFAYLVILMLYPFPIWSVVSLGALFAGIAYSVGKHESDVRRGIKEWVRILVIGVAFAWGISGFLSKKGPKVEVKTS